MAASEVPGLQGHARETAQTSPLAGIPWLRVSVLPRWKKHTSHRAQAVDIQLETYILTPRETTSQCPPVPWCARQN